MNNILTFEDYKKMNIRQVESVIYRQFIEENIKEEVNEGLIRKAINKSASKFIQNALADEIEKGKELEKQAEEIPEKIGACIPLKSEEAEELYRLLYQILKNGDESHE